MVGRTDQEPQLQDQAKSGGVSNDQGELFDFTNYPERWAFRTRRVRGLLSTMGVGFYAATKQRGWEVEFVFKKDRWVFTGARNYDSGALEELPADVARDMYREFAYHKARWKAKKERQLEGEFTRTIRRQP